MLILGEIGPHKWNYVKVTFIFVYLFVIYVVATVPDHFLEEHLWEHVTLKHLPSIFLWTLGVIGILALFKNFNLSDNIIQYSKWIIIIIAGLVGLIPESGPHLVFVILFARGVLPFSVLLTNSIVQDGHGMIPLLAHSRKDFFIVKGINFIVGILAGFISMTLGF